MQESNEETDAQRRIVDYAIDKFWRYGYTDITIDEIVAELRMSKATFYSAFKSKESLVVEAARSYYEKVKEYHFGKIDSTNRFVDELKGLMRYLVGALERVDARARRDIRTSVPKAWVKMQTFQHDAVNTLMDSLLSTGQRNGILRADLNIKIVSVLLTLSAESIINGETIGSLGMNRMDALQSFVDVFFGGLLAEPVPVPVRAI